MKALLSLLLTLAPVQERVAVQTPAAPEAGQRVFVIHDVSDLIRPPTGPGAELDEVRVAEQTRAQGERLVEAIRTFVVPELHPELDELELPAAGTLVVLARQAHQDRIQAFLDLQRATQGRMLDVSARIVEGPRGAFGELLGTEASAAILETREEAGELLRRFQEAEGFEVVSAPRIVALSRQLVSLSVIDRVAYVKEYELHVVEPGGVELADPVVETISEGVEIGLVGTPVEEDLYAIDVELDLTELVRPIATRKVRVRAGQEGEFEVGMPEVNTVRVTSHLLLSDGATAVLLAASPTEDRDLAVLFGIDVVEPEAYAPPTSAPASRPGSKEGERRGK